MKIHHGLALLLSWGRCSFHCLAEPMDLEDNIARFLQPAVNMEMTALETEPSKQVCRYADKNFKGYLAQGLEAGTAKPFDNEICKAAYIGAADVLVKCPNCPSTGTGAPGDPSMVYEHHLVSFAKYGRFDAVNMILTPHNNAEKRQLVNVNPHGRWSVLQQAVHHLPTLPEGAGKVALAEIEAGKKEIEAGKKEIEAGKEVVSRLQFEALRLVGLDID